MKTIQNLSAKEEAYWREQIRRADAIASKAHKGQKDKGGRAYAEHPRAVAAMLDDPLLKTAALLHDVIEDTEWTADDLLAAGIHPKVVETVCTLTHQEQETYDEYLTRVGRNPLAVEVKLADLRHNSQLDRIPNPGPNDFERLKKYARAQAFLLGKRLTPKEADTE